DKILQAGGKILDNIKNGIIDNLSKVVSSAGRVISSVISGITDGLEKVFSAGGKILKNITSGIVDAIPTLAEKVPRIVSAVVNGIKDGLGKMYDVGGNLLKGLWNGISNMKEWLVSKIKSLGSTVTAALKEVLGIHSPSTVFRDQIGKNMALGLGEGFEKTMGNIKKDMQKAVPTSFDIQANLRGVKALASQPVASNIKPSNDIVLNLTIEKFTNNGTQDIKKLADEISTIIASQIRRKGEVF
ncbi:MAG: hypothetical protein Q4C99_00385, partial [Clostridia bacterium]|nr:hypothetical protein [Clostridia bacterium]